MAWIVHSVLDENNTTIVTNKAGIKRYRAAGCKIEPLFTEPQLPQWRPIDSAPKDKSVLLLTANSTVPIYCGRKRYGQLGEPQQDVFAWRCDSSGRFGNPTHFMPLPQAPQPEPPLSPRGMIAPTATTTIKPQIGEGFL